MEFNLVSWFSTRGKLTGNKLKSLFICFNWTPCLDIDYSWRVSQREIEWIHCCVVVLSLCCMALDTREQQQWQQSAACYHGDESRLSLCCPLRVTHFTLLPSLILVLIHQNFVRVCVEQLFLLLLLWLFRGCLDYEILKIFFLLSSFCQPFYCLTSRRRQQWLQ